MDVITLLKREIKQPIRTLIIFLIISGFANALLIGIINAAAESTSNSVLNGQLFLLFICAFLVVIYTKKYVLDRSSNLVESILYRIRHRLTDKIRHTELQTLESIGTSPLYARLTMDVTTISSVSSTVISSAQAAIMIAFTFLYIGYVSLWSFFLVTTITITAFLYTRRRISSFKKMWKVLSRKETAFFDRLGHILQGFKEIKIDRSKSEDVFNGYVAVNKDLKAYRVELNMVYNSLLVLAQIALFFLMGCILFLLPKFHAEHSEVVYKVTAAILFAAGPLEGLMTSLELFDNANIAARNIMDLETELEAELKKHNLTVEAQNQPEAYQLLPFYDNVEFRNLSYSYPPTEKREHIFTVGPFDLKFRKGELIFITGGNGSGKSTFLKLITGLYAPTSGQIVLDTGLKDQEGTVIKAANYPQYRNLFSTIFSDFHLFDQLYGMEEVSEEVVNRLLANMELPRDQVSYKNGVFTNLDLSSGQKKRLALTIGIMEDKPIYVFDEVAADLDPAFRDKYYYELLKELKERNKTVIVVSHDRHYWTIPDRIFEMDKGHIRELTEEEVQSLLNLANV